MKNTLTILLWISCPFFIARASADIVTLKDGRQISGVIEAGATRDIRIQVANEVQVIAVDRIQTIQFIEQGAIAPDPAPQSVLPDPPPAAISLTAPSSVSQSPGAPQSITLPVGTEISVRTINRIESKNANLDKEYAASLDDPIVVDGVTVVPANASAFLRVSDVHSPGFARRASLSMSLVAVMVNGERVGIETGKVDSTSGSRAKRTAAGAVIGAGTGAAIGALAGGAIGAGVGAGIGSVGGAIAGRMTGKSVEIPSETRFTYKLSQPAVVGFPADAR